MKILQINSVCGVGSTGRIATDIHHMLIEKGHKSYIAYGRDEPKNCENIIKIGTDIDNYTHLAKTRLLDRHGFGSKKATIDFIDNVKKLNPDVIHLHNIHGYYMNIEILFNYLKKANKPVVWTLHDCWSFTGHCAYFEYAECDKWKTGCHSCPQKISYPSSLVVDNSQNNYINKKAIFTGIKNLTIVTPSKWLARLVKESFLSEYPVKVINNGIDLNVFRPSVGGFKQRFNLNDKFIILGVASVWDSRKGLKYFIEMVDKLMEKEVIVLVGLTEKQIKLLPDNIIGITKTNNLEELVDIYSSADVFVNPTLEDNFPTTNLEALACGTPVITYNSGGAKETIYKSYGKVISNKSNYKDILENIRNLNYSDIFHKELSFLSKEKTFNSYLQLYSETVVGG